MSAPTEAAAALTPEQLGAYLQDKLGEKVLDVSVAYAQVTVTVEPDNYVAAAQLCKDDDALRFDFWEFNSGVDLAEQGFALVTGLYSVTRGHRILLRMVVPGGREAPVAPTLTGLYRGANWSERETYDMFGIEFEGHPQLLPRILTVENFEGWPLRKEFLLMTREAKPWPGDKEPEDTKDDAKGPSKGAATTSEAPVSAEDKANAAKAKAERAKAKAAAARKKKAEQRAAAEGDAPAPAAEPGTAPTATGGGAEGHERGKPAQADGPEPQSGEVADAAVVRQDESPSTPDDPDTAVVKEADTAGGVVAEPDAEGTRAAAAAAAGADVPADTPDPSDPAAAAEAAETPIAKDAAAGAVGGDAAAGAPGDSPGTDQPVEDPEHEAKMGTGGAPMPSGSPGVEQEGRHTGADEQSGSKPAAETPGMTADPPGGAGAPVQEVVPAPGPDADEEDAEPPSATQGPPSTPGGSAPDEPQTGTTTLADEQGDDAPATGETKRTGRAGSAVEGDRPSADTGAGPGSGTDAADRGGPVYNEEHGEEGDGR